MAVVATNLHTNPNFESVTAGSTIFRTNLCLNPNMETNVLQWTLSGGGTIVQSNEWSASGTYSAKATSTSPSATAGDFRLSGGSQTNFPTGTVAGGTYLISAVCNTPAAHNGFVSDTGNSSRQRRILVFYSLNGSTFTQAFGPQGPNVSGTYTVSTIFTIPANATGAIFAVGIAGSPTDLNFVTYVDNVLIENTDQIRPYFDGSTVDVNGWDYAWTGTANASTSTAKGALVEIRRNVALNPGVEFAGAGSAVLRTNLATYAAMASATGYSSWYGSGGAGGLQALTGSGYALCDEYIRGTITTAGTAPSTYGVYAPGNNAGTNLVTAGLAYSFRVAGRTSRTVGTTEFRMSIRWQNASNVQIGSDVTFAVPWAGTGVWHEAINENVIAPALATNVSVFAWFASTANSVVGETYDMTGVLIEQAVTVGFPFHGAQTDTFLGGYHSDFAGTTNASSSRLTGYTSSGWAAASGAGSVIYTRQGLQKHLGSNAYRGDTLGTTTFEGILYTIPRATDIGDVVSAGVWVKGEAGVKLTMFLRLTTNTVPDKRLDFIATGAWQWLQVDGHIATAASSNIQVMIRTTLLVKTTIFMDDVFIEFADAVGVPFDGTTPNWGDFVTAWAGTVNASESVQYGASVFSLSTAAFDGTGNAIGSYMWSERGARSLCIHPTGKVNGSYAYVSGTSFGLQGYTTYTIMATARLNEVQQGPIDSRPWAVRGIDVRDLTVGAPSPDIAQATFPNTPGTYPLRLTFTTPSDPSKALIVFSNGSGITDVYFDSMVIISGDYYGPFFDGDTPNTLFAQYAWSGTAGMSSTVQTNTDMPVQELGAPYGEVVANNSKGVLKITYRSGWVS